MKNKLIQIKNINGNIIYIKYKYIVSFQKDTEIKAKTGRIAFKDRQSIIKIKTDSVLYNHNDTESKVVLNTSIINSLTTVDEILEQIKGK